MENNQEMNENEGVSLLDLVKIVKKNIIWIAGITIGITLLVLIYAFAIAKPTYKSNASIIVNSNKFNEGNSENYTNALRATGTISKWLTDPTVVEATIEDLGLEESVNLFTKKIKTIATTTELIIYVSVEGSSPETAQKYLTALLENSLELSDSYTQLKDSYEVLGKASDGAYASPNKMLYALIGIVAGLVVGLAFAFIKECFRTKYNEVKEVENKLKVSVIGTILNDDGLKGKTRKLPISKINENNYERLISNIDFSNVDGKIKTVAFTSSIAEEGKSSTIFEISKIMERNQKKVLIIDLDIRKAKIHKYFGIPRGQGVTDYVTEQATLEDVVVQYSENVHIVTAGKSAPNPTIILQASKLKELIDELKEKYDYVLIDTPPMFVAADAKTISTYSDAMILIVAAYSTPISFTKETIKDLNAIHSNVLGAVVTRLKPMGKRTYESYYSYYTSPSVETEEQ